MAGSSEGISDDVCGGGGVDDDDDDDDEDEKGEVGEGTCPSSGGMVDAPALSSLVDFVVGLEWPLLLLLGLV